MSLAYMHLRPMHPCPLMADEVTTILDEEVREIMQVRFGYRTQISPLQVDS